MDEGFDQMVVAPTTKNPKPPKPVAEKTPKQKLESATRQYSVWGDVLLKSFPDLVFPFEYFWGHQLCQQVLDRQSADPNQAIFNHTYRVDSRLIQFEGETTLQK